MHIRHCILFVLNKNAAEATKTIRSTFGDNALTRAMRERRYQRFRKADFQVRDLIQKSGPARIVG
ncbi:hypothetical protein WH47_07599 [Habropoda laboriosa]|uniref:Mos1 transposase HTH domain-containing protein n=1 Tax=Habropoda laboriosa TaxID=597456 RepID=A0A0L7RE76_9HYME|nr:hypothetical protein WH47_07599 [Habropoda laboriosa]